MTTTKKSYRALIVDDDEDSRDLMESALSMAGFVCSAAPHAEAAVEVIAASRPDAIVTDLTLPEMSGEELARFIRSQNHLTPILLVATSGRDMASFDRSLFDIVSGKPVDIDSLVASMNALFESRARTGTFSSALK